VLLERFFASGQYRKTLVLYLDMMKLSACGGDVFALYREIVDITFQHLAAQRFDVSPYAKPLAAHFARLNAVSSLIPLPHAFAQEDQFRSAIAILNIIAERLYSALHCDQSLNAWLTQVVSFPRSIALAFGFGSVHFVLDHLDAADLDIVPQPPLGAEDLSVSLMESLKFMLNADSFAASCVNEAAFLGLLASLGPNSIDLRAGTEIVTVLDLDRGHPARYEFRAIFPIARPAALHIRDCGGAPGYLSVWDRATQLADKVRKEEKAEESSLKARELRLLLIATVEVLVGSIHRSGDDGATRREVINVEMLDITTEIEFGVNEPGGRLRI
jgi:hypothetical protein